MNIKRMSMILAGLVLCFVLAIGLIPGIMPEAKAEEYTDNGIKYTYNDTDHTATVTGYKPESISNGAEIWIPREITVNQTKYMVNSIGDGALQNIQAGILHIPDSVTSIGSKAFSATGLTEITIPNSVTSIGEFAFSGCKLTCVISLPSAPPTLETNVFNLVDSGTPFFVYGPAYETAAGWSGFKDQMTMISIVTLNDGITATGEPPVATDSTGIYYKEGTTLTLSGSDSGYCVIDTASKTNITKNVISGNVLTVPAADVIIAKNISHTVTFKVVNGAWNDQTTGDIVKKIIYSDYEDIAPVLQPEDIPPVGDSPAAGYKKEGSWTEGTEVIRFMPPDITIRSDHTYTYTYEAKATAALTVSQADGVYGTALADPAYTRPAGAIGNPVITYSGTAWDGSAYGPSSEKPAQAGGYTVSMQEETADTVYSGSASFSVAPKSITDAAVSLDKTQMTYNGSEQHVSVTGVTINGLSLAEKDYEATGSTGTNVGSYSVKVTGKGNFKDTATTAWSIVDKAMMVAAGGFKGAYDGTEHGITVSVTDPAKGAEIRYGTAEGTYNLEASPTLTDAGAMTVYFIVTAENYADYTGSAAVTVTPKSITGAAVSLDKTQMTYNGSEQHVSVTGVTINGLSLAEKDYEATGSTGTNAGSYSVEVTGKGNFKDSATAAWSIVGKAMTVTAEGFKGPYDGTEHGITVSVTEPAKGAEIRYGTAEGTYDLEAGPTLTDAGNLTVYFRVTAENYTEYTGSAAVQITAVPATVAAEAKTKVFETADPELTAVVAGVLEGEKLNYTLSRAAGENAGEYAIAVALGENPNYEVEAAGATFTITRAEAAVTKVPTAISGLVCNNTTQELVTAGTASGGTIRYALGEDSTTPPASGWNAGIPAGTDAGTYHVWYKAAGDENHTDSAAACVSVKIDPKKKDEEGIPALVTRCYRYLLGREPDADGKAAWIEQMESGNLTACGIMLGFLNSDEYKAKGDLTNKAFVDALYRTMLDRAPDPAGKAYWMAKLTGGSTRQDVIVGFCRSVEFNRISIKEGIKADSGKADAAEAVSPAADMRKIRAFVAKCYTYFLGREPDMDGLYYWADRLGYGGLTAVKTVEAFMTSDEFLSRKLSNESIVKALYLVMLNRSSDPEGEEHWTSMLNAGDPVAVVINGIASSPEFKGICEEYGMVAGALKVAERPAEMIPEEAAVYEKEAPAAPASEYTNEEKIKAFVEHCYKAVFGRDVDAEGVANYTKAILDGTKTPKSTAREFVFSSEFQGKLPGNEEFIRILYRLYFDWEPGAEELSGWIQMLEDGASLEDIVNGFAGSEEFKTIVNEMK